MMVKIYKIVDRTNGNVYVGKTKQKLLSARLSGHRNRKNCRAYDIIQNGDYFIELIEETEDETRERYWIENSDNCINKNIPCRTEEEVKRYRKEWNLKNKEKLRAYHKTPEQREKQKQRSALARQKKLSHKSLDA